MHSTALLSSAAVLVGQVFAQSTSNVASASTTATAPSSTKTDIVNLVDQLPTCALPCLDSAATAINCNASDLPCLCSKKDQLATNIGPCVLFSSCSSDDQTKICQNIGSAQPAQVAAASSYIASAMASESASTASGNTAVRTDAPVAGVGVMGAAAALAMLAL
ncbi:hypothetical protein N0V82_002156 [Gnomoniopsis sp. IMI 355080]|nr:hypothetical protein N0V82_002156 [Gnomoniopsis sp. IMI 355080]